MIDSIYEAALVPTLWPHILCRITQTVHGSACFLFGVRDGYVSDVSDPCSRESLSIYMTEGLNERDLILGRAMALNHAGFLIDADLMTAKKITFDKVYRDFCRKHGIVYRACTIIPISNGDSFALVVARHQDHGPVPRSVVNFLDGLRRHLVRSSLTANRLGFERAMAQTEAVQALRIPAAVLRSRGRVFAANALFEALIPALFQYRARITIVEPVADQLLAEAIASLANTGAIKSFPIPTSNERLPSQRLVCT